MKEAGVQKKGGGGEEKRRKRGEGESVNRRCGRSA